MTLFIRLDDAGAGSGTVDSDQAFADLLVDANLDTGLGFTDVSPTLQQVTYARTDPGIPATRLDTLINTNFNVNPQNVDILVLAVGSNFVLTDGSLITTRGGTALPVGHSLNPTTSCLVLYDIGLNNGDGYCVARDGTGGDLDLPITTPSMLYHELSHAFRIVTTGLLPLSATCDPSSPEENAAIVDENDARDQEAVIMGVAPVHRDPGIHCGDSCGGAGSCCVVATVSSGSFLSDEVVALRAVRERIVRPTEVGHAFFAALHRAYYAFSPEVVRLMGRRPQTRPLILTHYVQPLVRTLHLALSYTADGLRGAELGARARVALAGVAPPPHDLLAGEDELAEILITRAVEDKYVQWGLIKPLGILYAALTTAEASADDAALGAVVARAVDEWAAELPIADVWPALSTGQARKQLRFLCRVLLASPESRARFGARLAAAYPTRTLEAAIGRELTEGVPS